MAYQPKKGEPRPGEIWKWAWLWVSIKSVGPKTVTAISLNDSSLGEVTRSPKDKFLARFHRTNMPVQHPAVQDHQDGSNDA